MSQRSTDGGEHEGSRRMKTELLIQMDGLAKTDAHVFLLAASNLPWELDTAMLRRLEKRICIDVPDREARLAMLQKWLPPSDEVEDLDYDDLADKTNGYSGSDVHLVCREAAMRPLRQLFHLLDVDDDEQSLGMYQRPKVSQSDVLAAIESTKSTSDQTLSKKYHEWAQRFGSV